jgi:UV DNA damage endonuclease
MMEGKSKDISLLKLKPDLLRFAPTSRHASASSEDAAELEAAEKLLEEGVAAETEPDVDEGGWPRRRRS